MIDIPFCQRCNTSIENYMQFCWNCGTKQGAGQFNQPPQQRVVVTQPMVQNQPVQQQGYYQQGFVVSGPAPQPYSQGVTVTYGGGPPGTAPAVGMNQGQMQMQRQQAIVPCPFCEGEGHHPMNFDQPCPVCHGAAKFAVNQPFTTCQQCDGSGKKFATIDQMCPACQGRGVIQL